MTIQQMIDTAMEEGASVFALWAVGRAENFWLKFTDDGLWFFVDDRGDNEISETDARRLLQCFQTGYAA